MLVYLFNDWCTKTEVIGRACLDDHFHTGVHIALKRNLHSV